MALYSPKLPTHPAPHRTLQSLAAPPPFLPPSPLPWLRHAVDVAMPANEPRVFVFSGLTPRRRYAVSFAGVQPTPRRYGIVQTPAAEACAVAFVAVYANANTPDSTLPIFEAEVRG